MEASILITVCEILLRSLKKACEWSINEESSDRWAKHHTNIQNLLDDLKGSYKSVGKINIITKRIDNLNLSKLRGSLDSLKKEVSNLIIILVGSMEEKSTILVSVSNDITATYDARNLLDSLSKIIGAKGGGKPDFAQAGGPASNKLDEILISAEKILTEI